MWPAVLVAGLVPAALMVNDMLVGDLGANPIQELTHRTGFAAIVFLVLTLAVTPARRLLRAGALMRFRRMLGLFAFFYVSLHLLIYVVDQTYLSGLGLSPTAIVEDIVERPFITLGFLGFLLLTPLAVTSTKGWVRRLGGRRWQVLHWLVYPAAVAGAVHFFWSVKADTTRPAVAAAILAVLLGYRVVVKLAGKRLRRPAPQPVAESSASGSMTPMKGSARYSSA
jgi:sulfoxide reductase heme-binding subunit YedZ